MNATGMKGLVPPHNGICCRSMLHVRLLLDVFSDLWERQSVTCGLVMVPCPWFLPTWPPWASQTPGCASYASTPR